MMYVGINIILTVSLNLVNGYMGEFSLAHAGFMAVGAYTAALLTMKVLPVAGVSGVVSAGGAGRRAGGGAAGADRGDSLVQGARRLSGHHHPGLSDDRQVGDREHRLHRRPARHSGHQETDHAALGVFLGGGLGLGDPQLRLFQLRARRAVDPRGRDRQRPDERQHSSGQVSGVHGLVLFRRHRRSAVRPCAAVHQPPGVRHHQVHRHPDHGLPGRHRLDRRLHPRRDRLHRAAGTAAAVHGGGDAGLVAGGGVRSAQRVFHSPSGRLADGDHAAGAGAGDAVLAARDHGPAGVPLVYPQARSGRPSPRRRTEEAMALLDGR